MIFRGDARVRRKLLLALAGYLVGMAATFGGLMLWRALDRPPPPVRIESVEVERMPREGEDLVLRIWREKSRICPLASRRRVFDQAGRLVKKWEVRSLGGSIEEGSVRVVYQTAELPPGSYMLRVRLLYDCGIGDRHEIRQDPAAFAVLPREGVQ